jgi:hypothetical protein
MNPLSKIQEIHTLGPKGTNCEAAAWHWFSHQGRQGRVHLYPTLEATLEAMPLNGDAAMLGCIVYPKLHTLVFNNLEKVRLVDCFIMKTLNMVLASKTGEVPRSISTHPAPESLLNFKNAIIHYSTSNSQAALDCLAGISEGCITTLAAMKEHGLKLVEDYGRIEMGFTIHAPALQK